MTTKVYGTSDDLIEFEGDVEGEVCSSDSLLICSDGTLLHIQYGKHNKAIWKIEIIEAGPLFKSISICTNEDGDVYSDTISFYNGLTYAYAMPCSWEKVQ